MGKKLSGIYRHHLEGKNFMLFRGFDDTFCVPHSRYTTVLRKDVEKVKSLKILASSPEAGIYAIKTNEGRQIFLLGHAEYDADTLKKEYFRDLEAGINPAIPGLCLQRSIVLRAGRKNLLKRFKYFCERG